MRNDLWGTTSIKYSTMILQKSAYLGYVSEYLLLSLDTIRNTIILQE